MERNYIHMNILLVTPTSVSVELENKDCYSTAPFEVLLNSSSLGMREHNSFSLYGLEPDRDYELKISSGNGSESVSFHTLDRREIVYRSSKDGGAEDDTAGIQQAIDHLKPDEFLTIRGVYKAVSLFLRDGLILHLPKGSRLVGETDRAVFPILSAGEERNGIVLGTWEGCADDSFASILTGIGVKNVCIYGQGIVDCNAQSGDWWVDHRTKRIARRPKGIFLHTCENIALEGITVCNTPSWNQHPFYSRDLKYINMKLLNPAESPTTDGIDPESCDNVLIVGVQISVGDDCIAIKSGKIDLARRYHTPSSRITIRNCLMEYGHGGVTLGSENSGGIRDVLVTNCIFRRTDRGLRIKSQRGRGSLAVIRDITFRNIRMEDVKAPFVINAFYKAGNDAYDERFIREYQEPTDLTPVFQEFTFEDIICEKVSYGVGFFLGLPESMLEKVALRNISVSYKPGASPGQMAMTAWKEEFLHTGVVCENVKLLELERVHFADEPDRKYILNNVTEVHEIS
ncbi:MAG: glycoside hydrolase family 28 protein [Eubacterium sp.]|nr:glycoside hydrolase family 28 protein [Eubacterium sp.]